MKEKSKWHSFNTKLAEAYQKATPETYNDFEKIIKKTIENTFKKITIVQGQFKPKLNDAIKKLKTQRKEARKIFEKSNIEEKAANLDKYVKIQIELKNELERHEKTVVEKRIRKIISEGGVKSDLFWKIRKKVINNSKPDEDYDTITEDDRLLTDPTEAKEHIAKYYEDLYQAREGQEE